jgi:hypothetical protein
VMRGLGSDGGAGLNSCVELRCVVCSVLGEFRSFSQVITRRILVYIPNSVTRKVALGGAKRVFGLIACCLRQEERKRRARGAL